MEEKKEGKEKLSKKKKIVISIIILVITVPVTAGVTLLALHLIEEASLRPLPEDSLFLFIEFDEHDNRYDPGDLVEIYFNESLREFHLIDKMGSFTGTYKYTGSLELDFYGYKSSYISFINETHFTAIEAAKSYGGLYSWV